MAIPDLSCLPESYWCLLELEPESALLQSTELWMALQLSRGDIHLEDKSNFPPELFHHRKVERAREEKEEEEERVQAA